MYHCMCICMIMTSCLLTVWHHPHRVGLCHHFTLSDIMNSVKTPSLEPESTMNHNHLKSLDCWLDFVWTLCPTEPRTRWFSWRQNTPVPEWHMTVAASVSSQSQRVSLFMSHWSNNSEPIKKWKRHKVAAETVSFSRFHFLFGQEVDLHHMS